MARESQVIRKFAMRWYLLAISETTQICLTNMTVQTSAEGGLAFFTEDMDFGCEYVFVCVRNE